MKHSYSRRSFIESGALIAVACAASKATPALAGASMAAETPSPVKLGLASYTIRNFSRAQMIGYMKQLNISNLNVKDVKDHLPSDAEQEAIALKEYDL